MNHIAAQLQARGMVVEVAGVRQFGPAVRMTAMPSSAARAAPSEAGADTEAMRASQGGDAATIERRRAAGVAAPGDAVPRAPARAGGQTFHERARVRPMRRARCYYRLVSSSRADGASSGCRRPVSGEGPRRACAGPGCGERVGL